MSAIAAALETGALPETRALRWISYGGHDLTHPAYVADLRPRAAWVALDGEGWPVVRGPGNGISSSSARLFNSAADAQRFGRPVCVDLLWGRIARAYVDPATLPEAVVVAPYCVALDAPADGRAA